MGLKSGVVGCGRMGAESSTRLYGKISSGWLPISHAESLLQCQQVENVFLCESNENRLSYLEDKYPQSEKFMNIDSLLLNEPDILTIATRTPEKKEIIKKAIEKNVKGIYVEKPFANNLSDCKSLLKLAKDNNVFVSYGVNRRFHSTYRKVKEEIQSGIIGKLTHVVADFGLGGLFWNHAHSMDLLLFFAGTPLTVRSELDNVEHDESGDIRNDPILLNAEIKFENGIIGSVTNIPGYNIKLVGEKGFIVIHADAAFIEKYLLCENTGCFTKHSIEHTLESKSATVTALEELSDAVISQNRHDFENKISPSEILTGMKLLFGCVESHLKAGSFVKVENIQSEYNIHAISYGNYA